MELKFFIWFICMFAVGGFVYTMFGMQIGIVNNCAMKLHYMIRNDTDFFYSDACLIYLKKVKRRNRIIIGVIVAIVLFVVPVIGNLGFFTGYFIRKLTTYKHTRINDNNLADTKAIFLQFAKPNMEKEFEEALTWVMQKLKYEDIFKYI